MYYIKDAKIRRFTELDGVRCAEVEVRPGAADDPELLVYITAKDQTDGQHDYDMVRIIRNDANLELDWYDNNLHSAFEEVTDKAFTDSTHITAGEEREKFKKELFRMGNSVQSSPRSSGHEDMVCYASAFVDLGPGAIAGSA